MIFYVFTKIIAGVGCLRSTIPHTGRYNELGYSLLFGVSPVLLCHIDRKRRRKKERERKIKKKTERWDKKNNTERDGKKTRKRGGRYTQQQRCIAALATVQRQHQQRRAVHQSIHRKEKEKRERERKAEGTRGQADFAMSEHSMEHSYSPSSLLHVF